MSPTRDERRKGLLTEMINEWKKSVKRRWRPFKTNVDGLGAGKVTRDRLMCSWPSHEIARRLNGISHGPGFRGTLQGGRHQQIGVDYLSFCGHAPPREIVISQTIYTAT